MKSLISIINYFKDNVVLYRFLYCNILYFSTASPRLTLRLDFWKTRR